MYEISKVCLVGNPLREATTVNDVLLSSLFLYIAVPGLQTTFTVFFVGLAYTSVTLGFESLCRYTRLLSSSAYSSKDMA